MYDFCQPVKAALAGLRAFRLNKLLYAKRFGRLVRAGDDAHRKKDWAGAAVSYAAALEIKPEHAGIWVQYGHVLKESGDRPAAEAAYRRAIALRSDEADTSLQLGHVLKLMGRTQEAAFSYISALKLDPNLRPPLVELLHAGWTAFDIHHALAKDIKPAPEDPIDIHATLSVVLDVSDLLHYFQSSRLPTGIQRVQMGIATALIDNPPPGVDIRIGFFTVAGDYWRSVPKSFFKKMCTLSLVNGNADEPQWRSVLFDLASIAATARPLEFRYGAFLVNLGTSWWLANYFLHIRHAKETYGIRYVPFVHDCIPLVTPEHCAGNLVQEFVAWIAGVHSHADFCFVNSRSTEADVRKISQSLGVKSIDTHVVLLDARFSSPATAENSAAGDSIRLRNGLESTPYVLFVSTIESRKNHLFAFEAWLEMIERRGEANTPMLVCVGKLGWLYDAAIAKLDAEPALQRKVKIIAKVSDDELAALYEHSRFTVYPSLYEGWGLPITEALCYGKVPVAANSSSLPEAGGDFADYFEPGSRADFIAKVERLIDDADYLAERNAHIRRDFKPRDWQLLAADLIGQLRIWQDRTTQSEGDSHGAPQPLLFEASSNHYYPLSRNHEERVQSGFSSNEQYRTGLNWWAPEDFGVWTKAAPAVLTFRVPASFRGRPIVCVRLCGLPAASATDAHVSVRCNLGGQWDGVLTAGTEQWIELRATREMPYSGAVKLTLSSSAAYDLGAPANGGYRRVVGFGAVGFFYRNADDFVDLNALGGIVRLQRSMPIGSHSSIAGSSS